MSNLRSALIYAGKSLLRLIVTGFRISFYSIVLIPTVANGLYWTVSGKDHGMEWPSWAAHHFIPLEEWLLDKFGIPSDGFNLYN